MSGFIKGVSYFLPEGRLTNEELAQRIPDGDPDKIFKKTGIRTRAIAAPDQTATDLAFFAAQNLLNESSLTSDKIDALIFCTQSPDYFLPTSACLLHNRLELPTTCAAFDYNLGCSGFTYGLWMARSLIASDSADNVLLLMGDRYSAYCDPNDLITSSIFGDAGSACWVSRDSDDSIAEVGPTILGTDGRGAENLIVSVGAARLPRDDSTGPPRLFMNGPEIFSFTLSSVKAGIQNLLTRCSLGWEDVDLFLFHQANRFMLDNLRMTMKIPESKVPIEIEDLGNTVSSSIPILVRRCLDKNLLTPGTKCVLAGFGVGYSWAMTLLTVRGAETAS